MVFAVRKVNFFHCIYTGSYLETKLLPLFIVSSANVFLSTLAKLEFRLEMLVGSCTAWSMEFTLMARCRATRQSGEGTIPSTRFSAKPERENTFLAPCSST